MKKLTTFLLGFLICLNISFACINDGASIHFEKQRFPEEEDLISGKFHIHSKDFYQWRIKDRLSKLKKEPNNPALLDDLSVSYEKTGQTQLAIDTLQSVLHKYPNRYETLANLGTFYIHHQNYEKGLELLRNAIKINPAAHYGREIYQIKVVEYIISLNKKPPFAFPIQKNKDFSDFLLKDIKKSEQKEELIRAIVGVSGMLKFGNSDSSILLEILGDLYLRIYNDYTWMSYENQLKDYAINFYIAAFLQSNPSIDISNSNVSSFLQTKGLIQHMVDKYSTKIERVQNKIIEGKNYKEILFKKEQEIINKTQDPEEIIYKTLFSKPKQQQDLFKSKHETIQIALNYSKKMFLGTIIEMFMLFLLIINLLLIPITLILSCFNINRLYFRNKFSNITRYQKGLLLMGMLWFNLIIITIPCAAIFSSSESFLIKSQIIFTIPLVTLPISLIYMLLLIRCKINIKNLYNDIGFKLTIKYYKFYLWFSLLSIFFGIVYLYIEQIFNLPTRTLFL